MDTKTITKLGMLLALSLVFAYIEYLIPVFSMVPGVRLGIANVVTMYVLYNWGTGKAFIILMLRVIISGILFNGLNSVVFGLIGGICCILIMTLLKRMVSFSVMGVSIAGAVFHNGGQMITAFFIMNNAGILYYFPVLCLSGLVAGLVVGYISAVMINRFNITM